MGIINKYPPLYDGTDGVKVLNNFITSNVDLAAVIFELAGTELSSNYEVDGPNILDQLISKAQLSSKKDQVLQRFYVNFSQAISLRADKGEETDYNYPEVHSLYSKSTLRQLMSKSFEPEHVYEQLNIKITELENDIEDKE